MFGMGFTEILLIMVVAIIFIGPEKLPETVSQIFKFFKNLKSSIDSAKESLDQELKLNEMKEEAISYKERLTNSANELNSVNFLDDNKKESSSDSKVEVSKKEEPKREVISFAKDKEA
jgi:sec-independent protein translocase protein TatB